MNSIVAPNPWIGTKAPVQTEMSQTTDRTPLDHTTRATRTRIPILTNLPTDSEGDAEENGSDADYESYGLADL